MAVAEIQTLADSPSVPSLDALDKTKIAGSWKCVAVEGNFQEFMKAMGVGWMKRKMAATFSFGKGRMVQTISFAKGGKLTLHIKMGPIKETNAIILDGKLRKQKIPPGVDGEASSELSKDGNAIIFKVASKGLESRRFVDDAGRMRVELSCKGAKAARIFERSDAL